MKEWQQYKHSSKFATIFASKSQQKNAVYLSQSKHHTTPSEIDQIQNDPKCTRELAQITKQTKQPIHRAALALNERLAGGTKPLLPANRQAGTRGMQSWVVHAFYPSSRLEEFSTCHKCHTCNVSFFCAVCFFNRSSKACNSRRRQVRLLRAESLDAIHFAEFKDPPGLQGNDALWTQPLFQLVPLRPQAVILAIYFTFKSTAQVAHKQQLSRASIMRINLCI